MRRSLRCSDQIEVTAALPRSTPALGDTGVVAVEPLPQPPTRNIANGRNTIVVVLVIGVVSGGLYSLIVIGIQSLLSRVGTSFKPATTA